MWSDPEGLGFGVCPESRRGSRLAEVSDGKDGGHNHIV